jgi:hydrogenase maturation protease
MNLELVENIANAVLYEGYMLYPYRASSVKNRQRFNWGALAPESYSAAQNGTEAFEMQTECLVHGDENTTLDVKIRFLHLVSREIGKLENPLDELPTDSEPTFHFVPTLDVGGQFYQTWQEAIEREVDLPTLSLNQVSETKQFSFPTTRTLEPLRDENKKIVGVIVRTQQEIFGVIELRIEEVRSQKSEDSEKQVYKLSVKIKNQTPFEDAGEQSRDDALLHSLVSTHTILSANNGEFISLLEPPDELKEAVAACENIKTYPVLAGTEGERDCMLSSPIILYDYPQIAAESAGDLFDGAEIDEILTLRIMTLTDDEKREMRGIDARARKMLERTENMPEEQLLKMHGAMKGVAKSQGNNE